MARFAVQEPVQVMVVVVSAILIALPTIFIALRIWAKRLSSRPWDWSDTFIMISWFISVPYTAMSTVSVTHWGVGHHVQDIVKQYGQEPITEFLKFMVAGQVLWPMSVSSVKFSVLFFYLKLFKGTHSNWQHYVSFGLIGIHVLYSIATILLAFTICQPLSKYWKPQMTTGHCGDTNKSYTSTGVVDFVTDFAIVTLPLPSFFQLQAKRTTKLWLLVTFMGGYLTTALSLARLITISRVDMKDLTYNVPTVLVLGTAEPVAGIVCVCMPMLQPLLRGNGLSSTTGGSSGKEPSSGPLSRSREWTKVGDDHGASLHNQDDSSETELRRFSVEASRQQHGRGAKLNNLGSKNLIAVQQEWEVRSASNPSL